MLVRGSAQNGILPGHRLTESGHRFSQTGHRIPSITVSKKRLSCPDSVNLCPGKIPSSSRLARNQPQNDLDRCTVKVAMMKILRMAVLLQAQHATNYNRKRDDNYCSETNQKI